MIRINNLKKEYISNKCKCLAIDHMNLVLPNKGMVFVVGKSGSGKTTLMNLIGGLDFATSGQIIVNGNDLSKLKLQITKPYITEAAYWYAADLDNNGYINGNDLNALNRVL